MEPGVENTPKIGRRINLHGYKGTVRYVGKIDGAQGTWLGVEWDDPSRGKHSGQKDGKQYFLCTVPQAGSFIRLSPSITYGHSFLQALISKYVEPPRTAGQKETVILGSSNGVIEVEAIGLNKVRSKLAKLEHLREISLDGEDVAFPDTSGKIRKMCPNVRSLDLSSSLLPSWDTVALIAAELPVLQTLSLNRNRFTTLTSTENLVSGFLSLTDLRLNQTLVTWPEVILLLSVMPKLKYLELGYNGLKCLGGTGTEYQDFTSQSTLEVLNTDCNELEEWSNIMTSIRFLTKLDRLILTANRIRRILPPAAPAPMLHIKHVGLQDNYLSCWSDVDALNAWLPNLETLTVTGNPLVIGSSDFRQLTVAKLPSLRVLNGTSISVKERGDCEIFYLSRISRGKFASDEERSGEHPRWKELVDKHGEPDRPTNERGHNTLAQRLISINVYRCTSAPPEGRTGATAPKTFRDHLPPPLKLQVLPTMSMRVFRLKLRKALKIPPDHRSHLGAWLLMDRDNLTELDLEQETCDLAWWGIQDGSDILVYPN